MGGWRGLSKGRQVSASAAGGGRRALARPPLSTLPTRLINEEGRRRADGERRQTDTKDRNAEEGRSLERERERGQEINYRTPTH